METASSIISLCCTLLLEIVVEPSSKIEAWLLIAYFTQYLGFNHIPSINLFSTFVTFKLILMDYFVVLIALRVPSNSISLFYIVLLLYHSFIAYAAMLKL